MGDSENALQPSKKRAAGVQLSRDNPGLDDNEDTGEQESGTFRRASDEILATRRIVKVRRQQPSSTPAQPSSVSSNPFAAIRLVPASSSAAPTEAKEDEKIDESKSQNKVDEQKGESIAKQVGNDPIDDSAKQSENEIDESKSENKVDKQKGELIAKQGGNDPIDDSAKQSENKVDDAESEPNVDKDEEKVESTAEKDKTEVKFDEKNSDATNNESKIETTKAVVESTGGNLDDGVNKSTETDEAKGNDKDKENETVATDGDNTKAAPFSSFKQLSSGQNAFSGFTGTGFSSGSFSFGTLNGDKATTGSGTASLFGVKSGSTNSSFSFSVPNGNSSNLGTNLVTKSESTKMVEVPVETGEENERSVFAADSILFEFTDGVWKERGKGEVKVNVPTTGTTGKARLVMRAKGNYRLILNASLFPDMNLTNMDKKGITFACMNSAAEGKEGLSTIALKFRDVSAVDEFRAVVTEHKSQKPVDLKTPENSPGGD